MSLLVCVAKNYQEFERWRDERVVYVGDKKALDRIDPAQVRDIIFIGDRFREHPIYFSDELFEFQKEVATAKCKPKKSWWKRGKAA